MSILLLIGAGGLVGAVLRHLVGTWAANAAGDAGIPYGTLAVNVLGCLAIGVVVGLSEAREPLSAEARAFLVVGLLGGFTTFSAFGIDTVRLLREGAYAAGSANVVLQVALGLASVVAGLRLAQWAHDRVAGG